MPAPKAADSSKEPIKIGFMNVDSAPIGVHAGAPRATDATEKFINDELGGMRRPPGGDRPCLISNGLPPRRRPGCAAQAGRRQGDGCARRHRAVRTARAADLRGERHSFVGGIPVNDDEMTSPVSFQFSGGSPGAFVAFAEQAVAKESAKKVAVLYADYPSIKSAAVDYGAAVAKARGAEVDRGRRSRWSARTTPWRCRRPSEGNPDAILVAAADLSCAPIMQAIVDLQAKATVYMVGSSADVKVLDKVGIDKLDGVHFNIENRIDQTADKRADTEIYNRGDAEVRTPGTTPRSAATVAFKGGHEPVGRAAPSRRQRHLEQIIEEFRKAKDAPSFDGHPYTCDGKQIPGKPAMCASAAGHRAASATATSWRPPTDGSTCPRCSPRPSTSSDAGASRSQPGRRAHPPLGSRPSSVHSPT